MEFVTISFEIWRFYCHRKITDYLLKNDIYHRIPSDVPWDSSGRVEKLPADLELSYVQNLEQDFWDENFLSTMHNGECRPSYVSGCGFFYDTYHDALSRELENELFSRLCDINNINDDENENYDALCDFSLELLQKWIHDILAEFTKEKVLEILKKKPVKNQK